MTGISAFLIFLLGVAIAWVLAKVDEIRERQEAETAEYFAYLRAEQEIGELAARGRRAVIERWLRG